MDEEAVMTAFYVPQDEDECGTDIYSRLMLHAAGLDNDDLFARMLSSQAVGEGVLPPGLGLTPQGFAALRVRHFSYMGPIGLTLTTRGDAGREPERDELVALLLEGRAGKDASETWMAEIVAAGCMGSDHLWRDLGLWSRRDLSLLMQCNFPALAARNDRDMKWKKFLYRQICEKECVPVCQAPSCQACMDYAKCFNASDI